MLALLHAAPGGGADADADAGYRSADTYAHLTWAVLGAGLVCSAVFLLFTREPPPPPERGGTEEEERAALLAEAEAEAAAVSGRAHPHLDGCAGHPLLSAQ